MQEVLRVLFQSFREQESSTDAGSDKILNEFATVLLAFPVEEATSSWVKPNSRLSLSRPLASSTGLRSSRCRFSISAEIKSILIFFLIYQAGNCFKSGHFCSPESSFSSYDLKLIETKLSYQYW